MTRVQVSNCDYFKMFCFYICCSINKIFSEDKLLLFLKSNNYFLKHLDLIATSVHIFKITQDQIFLTYIFFLPKENIFFYPFQM